MGYLVHQVATRIKCCDARDISPRLRHSRAKTHQPASGQLCLRVGKIDQTRHLDGSWEGRNKIHADGKVLLHHPLNRTIVEHLLCARHWLNPEIIAEDKRTQIPLLGGNRA